MKFDHRAIRKVRTVQLFFFLAAVLCLFLAITLIKNLFVSFILAFAVYYLLSPIVDFFERKGLSRSMATALPFVGFSIIFIVSATTFFPMLVDQFQSLKFNFPKYIEAFTSFLTQLEYKVTDLLKDIYPVDLKSTLEPRLMEWAQNIFKNLPELVSRSLIILILTPFLAYFMLLDGRDFVRKILALVPNNFFELGLHLNYQVGTQLGGFIRARLLETLLVSAVIWIGLLCLDFPYALVLAIFGGIINIIPYLGPFIGIIPALIINFSNGNSQTSLVWILVIYSLAQILDTLLIVPFVVAKIVNLHPVTVVLAVIVGSQAMGILGMIISIPLFSTLKVTIQAIYKHFTDFRA